MGPGAELKELLKSIGVDPNRLCKCEELIKLMNEWGVEGCEEPEHFSYIVTQMENKSKKYSWDKKISAAGRAALNGLVFKVNWLNPWPSLIHDAIRRSVENASCRIVEAT